MMPALTGLRFLLAALVMMYHNGAEQIHRAPAWAGSIVSFGFLAVNAFFILSGFVLAQSYLDSEGKMRGSRAEFWIARFARIYPVYALAILFSFPNRLENGSGALTATGEKIATTCVFTLTQSWAPDFSVFINRAAWSLSVEAFFYFAFPFVIGCVAAKSRRGLISVMAVCWILLLAPASLFVLAGGGLFGTASHRHRFDYAPRPPQQSDSIFRGFLPFYSPNHLRVKDPLKNTDLLFVKRRRELPRAGEKRRQR